MSAKTGEHGFFSSGYEQKRWVKVLSFLLSFAICIAVAYIYCSSKRIFDVDESLTFSLANEQTAGWVSYEPKGWFLRSVFSEYTATVPFSYSQVFVNQALDVHPPFYYLIIHTICSLMPGSFSVWYGLGLNLLLFLMNAILFYRILYKATDHCIAAGVGMVLYCLNFRILEGMIFLRMYQLTSTLVLIFFLIGRRIADREGSIDKIDFIFLTLVTILGGLTHYFFYFAIAACSLFFGIVLICRKRWAALICSAACVIGALCLNLLVFFPATRDHLFSEGSSGVHGQFVLTKLQSLTFDWDRLKYFVNHAWGGSLGFRLGLALLVLGVILLAVKRNRRYLWGVLALSSYYLNFLIVSQTATYLRPRYLLPMEAVGILGVMLVLADVMEIMSLRDIAFMPLLIMVFMESDFGKMSQYLQSRPSWEYAAEHRDQICVIVTDGNLPDYCINTSFPDLMQYKATGMTTLGESLLTIPEEDFILYSAKNLSRKKVMNYIRSELPDADVQFADPELFTAEFYVYEVMVND